MKPIEKLQIGVLDAQVLGWTRLPGCCFTPSPS